MATLPRRSPPAPELRALLPEPGGLLAEALARELRARGVVVQYEHPPGAPPPTHLFLGLEPRPRPERVREWIDWARGLEAPPRLVLCSPVGTRRALESCVRESGLPCTLARPGPRTDAGGTARERLLALAVAPLLAALRLATLGARGHAGRPTTSAELAFGLARTGLDFATLGRPVQGQELRRRSASAVPQDEPLSRRDGPRW